MFVENTSLHTLIMGTLYRYMKLRLFRLIQIRFQRNFSGRKHFECPTHQRINASVTTQHYASEASMKNTRTQRSEQRLAPMRMHHRPRHKTCASGGVDDTSENICVLWVFSRTTAQLGAKHVQHKPRQMTH